MKQHTIKKKSFMYNVEDFPETPILPGSGLEFHATLPCLRKMEQTSLVSCSSTTMPPHEDGAVVACISKNCERLFMNAR